jgi:hypothetical protein
LGLGGSAVSRASRVCTRVRAEDTCSMKNEGAGEARRERPLRTRLRENHLLVVVLLCIRHFSRFYVHTFLHGPKHGRRRSGAICSRHHPPTCRSPGTPWFPASPVSPRCGLGALEDAHRRTPFPQATSGRTGCPICCPICYSPHHCASGHASSAAVSCSASTTTYSASCTASTSSGSTARGPAAASCTTAR